MRATIGDRVFEFEQDPPIDVTSLSPRPDHGWRFTDAEGHEHRWVFDASGGASVPTLTAVQGTRYDEDYGDEYTVIEFYMCRQCEERILPGTVRDNIRQYRRGLIYGHRVDGVEVTEAEYLAELEKEMVKAGLKT